MQGQLDSELTDLGRAQTETNARVLAAAGIEALYCSPLGRARQSAEIVNRSLGLPLATDARLKEWHCGDWSGHLRDDVRARWPAEWAALEADRFHYRGPGCENYPDMIERVGPLLDELLAHAARRIAVVSHGLIGRVMIATLLGLDPAATLRIRQANDVVYRVTLDSGRRALAHYVAGEGPFAGAAEDA